MQGRSRFTSAQIDELKPPVDTVPIAEIISGLREEFRLDPKPEYEGKALEPRTEVILVDHLQVERAYQRNANVPHIRAIRDKFDPDSAQLPLVIRRTYDNNRLVVPDGQQRLIAEVTLGFKRVKCVVINCNSLQHEAEIFSKINIGRKSVPTAVIHRNLLLSEDSRAIQLEHAIRAAGFQMSERDGNCRVKGPTRLHATARAYGYETLTAALIAYRTIWPTHTGVHLYLNSGLALLLWTYLNPDSPTYLSDNQEAVAPEALAHRIGRRNPSPVRMIREAGEEIRLKKSLKQTMYRPSDTYRRENDLYYAQVLIKEYNVGGLGGGRKGLDWDRVWESYNYLKSRKGKSGSAHTDSSEPALPLAAAAT